MSYKATLNTKQLSEFNKKIDKLQKAFRPAGIKAVNKVASDYKKLVHKHYIQGGNPSSPLAASTLQKYTQGKSAGARPAISPKAVSKPLGISLTKLVQRKTKVAGNRSNTSIFLKPGVPMSGGLPSEVVGMINEFGETHTVVASARARTYLRALALGVAGTDYLVRPKDRKPITITIRIPARPVWQTAFVIMLSKQPKQFGNEFAKQLHRHSGVRVVVR